MANARYWHDPMKGYVPKEEHTFICVCGHGVAQHEWASDEESDCLECDCDAYREGSRK
jgi:hypothetical protein